jgi:hypothetical protein
MPQTMKFKKVMALTEVVPTCLLSTGASLVNFAINIILHYLRLDR